MAYSVLWTPDAEGQLDSIVTYIADTLCAPAAAVDLVDAIDAAAAKLAEKPYLHELVRDAGLAVRGYRKMGIKNYVVLYLVDEERGNVVITNIFHFLQDYARLV